MILSIYDIYCWGKEEVLGPVQLQCVYYQSIISPLQRQYCVQYYSLD